MSIGEKTRDLVFHCILFELFSIATNFEVLKTWCYNRKDWWDIENTYNKKLLPSNDKIFKNTFAKKGNEDILIDLLESILEVKIDNIAVKV